MKPTFAAHYGIPAIRAALTMLALGATLTFVIDAVTALKWAEIYPPLDGVIDWGGARATLADQNPYGGESLRAIGRTEKDGIGHPPTTLVWFFSLAHLDVMMMRQVFTVITLLMLVYHIAIVLKENHLPAWPIASLLVFAAVFQTDWFIMHLAQVDLSELIAFLYVLCWYFLRRGRDVPAGVMAGLACTLKIYPGLLLVFLVLGRRWRALIAAGAAYTLFAVEMIRRVGIGSYRDWLRQTGPITDKWIANIRNASINGIVHRWFYPLWRPFPEGRSVLFKANVISACLSLGLVSLAWLVSRRTLRLALGDPKQIDLPFALFSVLSIAPGPYQWEHYNVTLILPFFVLLAQAWHRARADGSWNTFAATSLALTLIAAMLDVSLNRRFQVASNAQNLPLSQVLFYEWTTWLPWLSLAILLGVRLLRDDARKPAELR